VQELGYVETLRSALDNKQLQNKSYSLRAMARDLDMAPSTLSLVFKGKRQLPKKNLPTVLDYLSMTPVEESLFRESYFKTKTKLNNIKVSEHYLKRVMIDENHYNILAKWEYYAVLTLMECDDFCSDHTWISKRLTLKVDRVNGVMKGLIAAKLIEINLVGEYKLTQGPLRTTEDINSKALKTSHLETLDIGKEKLESVAVELRDYSSMTVAIDPSKLQEAKAVIREFRQKMGSLLRDGEKTEVYQMAIQLYPLTEVQTANKLNTENTNE
jgi:uncharacterized protein (TIGR02147 family)